jgi:hypothetical protein
MKNTRRSSTFRAKALHREGHQLLPTTNFTTKSLCSERRSSPCIFHAVVSLSIPIFLILATTYTGTDQFKINSLLSPAVQRLSRSQTSKFSMTSFYVTSFICQVHVCICNKFDMTIFHMTSFIYWCERVNKFTWPILANHIFVDPYTDEQNLYFDNFFYDKCTCSKLAC